MMMPLLYRRGKSREEIELEIKSRNMTNLVLFCMLTIAIMFSAFVNPWLHTLKTENNHHFLGFNNDTNKTT